MIRAGRFYARITVDGYEIYDDTVRSLAPSPIRTVYLRATRSQIAREASAEVARLHHEATTTQRLTTAAGHTLPPSSS